MLCIACSKRRFYNQDSLCASAEQGGLSCQQETCSLRSAEEEQQPCLNLQMAIL